MSIGAIFVPELLACARCGALPDLTGENRCHCTIAQLLEATAHLVPADAGSPVCTTPDCGREGVVFRRVNSGEKPKCRTCAGLRPEVERRR